MNVKTWKEDLKDEEWSVVRIKQQDRHVLRHSLYTFVDIFIYNSFGE